MLANIKEITKMIEDETRRGIDLWGENHSRHEGYAVAKEEMDEMESEYDAVTSKMCRIWDKVKSNTPQSEMVELLEECKTSMIYMLAEGIQFAAMINKMIHFENK